MERCAAACADCHAACLRTALADGLAAGSARLAPEHFRLLMDCADLCATTADFMLRGSAFHERVGGVCAEVCAACAQSCVQFDLADASQQLQACRAACVRCAKSCREAAGAMR
ncbi:MAG: four-helix bundle copper-binding protein [Burkholderiales bacterium]|nr:four-helix bundle copper-binding protein [Burkholderiales bacterium]